ncbi:MAG: SUMF1/EgtB/PvdO family nonheme iron enzyme [Candidatus Margulisiibacteriota bacterium]|nr:SUMF1/EgtB/PvdO family nonheme iron enzyme [Candidatus Margulisiibacteriota bacterium]
MRQPGEVEVRIGRAAVGSEIKIPEMIEASESLAVMKSGLTVGQFRQFVEEAPYDINGFGADLLKERLESGKAESPLNYLNFYDARAYAKWLSKKTGRNFRIPTGREWNQASCTSSGLKEKMSGIYHHWTESKTVQHGRGKMGMGIYSFPFLPI